MSGAFRLIVTFSFAVVTVVLTDTVFAVLDNNKEALSTPDESRKDVP